MFHCGESYRKPHGPANICSLQGNISVLHALRICITTVHSDVEFAALQALVESLPGGPIINLASSNEHVPEIERKIRVVKGRCRAARHGLPFQRIAKILTIHIVFQTVKLLNFFPAQGGVGDILDYKNT